jgi:hypothetical protein
MSRYYSMTGERKRKFQILFSKVDVNMYSYLQKKLDTSKNSCTEIRSKSIVTGVISSEDRSDGHR